jgi:glutamyl-tRNA(Gln) amidotransferase subunit E
MYPETDVPPVEPDPSDVAQPELLTEKAARYESEYGLDATQAEQVATGQRWNLFEQAVEMGVDASLAASTVESSVTELRRDGVPVERLADPHFLETFELLADGELAKEGVGDLLTELADDPGLSAGDAAEQAGLGSAGEEEVREAVVAVVERNADQVEAEGMGAFSALMGECMGELRGQADGDLVSDVLREEIGKRS